VKRPSQKRKCRLCTLWHMDMRQNDVRTKGELYPPPSQYLPPSENPGFATECASSVGSGPVTFILAPKWLLVARSAVLDMYAIG